MRPGIHRMASRQEIYIKLLGNKHEAGLRVVVVYEQSGICMVKRYGSVEFVAVYNFAAAYTPAEFVVFVFIKCHISGTLDVGDPYTFHLDIVFVSGKLCAFVSAYRSSDFYLRQGVFEIQ